VDENKDCRCGNPKREGVTTCPECGASYTAQPVQTSAPAANGPLDVVPVDNATASPLKLDATVPVTAAEKIAAVLVEAGFPEDEAKKLGQAAVDEIAARQDMGSKAASA
jgi:hypothetical protein